MEILYAVIALVIVVGVISWFVSIYNKAQLYINLKPRLDLVEKKEEKFRQDHEEWIRQVQREKQAIQTLAKEKSLGFPWLAQAYADFFELQDQKKASYLEHKSRPAVKAAEQVREIATEKRKAEKLWRVLKYQLDYYESLFPWLMELKGEDLDDLIRQQIQDKSDITQLASDEDPARHWLTEGEYNTLSTAEKYQLALDRYWQKRKSKWELGRDYERFIGYQYEANGWHVVYQGIVEGFSDLGRDLITTKEDYVHVIQCKYWSHEKTIHEKHIFQLFGTQIAYRIDHPRKKVTGVFVTSTILSPKARQFAEILGISVREQVPLVIYPCVKCNVSRKTGEKIYHLPFDQQYDRTLVEEERHERYASTVREAEALGFRRAFRWRGEKS
jgi:hypothetical protein